MKKTVTLMKAIAFFIMATFLISCNESDLEINRSIRSDNAKEKADNSLALSEQQNLANCFSCGFIQGHVYNTSGNLVTAYTTLTFINLANGSITAVKSVDGSFNVFLPQGNYRVTITHPVQRPYYNPNESVSVQAGSTTNKDFTMLVPSDILRIVVKGDVRSSGTNFIVPGALVQYKKDGSTDKIFSTYNFVGYYQMDLPEPGTYQVKAFATGFINNTSTINLPFGETIKDIFMIKMFL